MIIHIGNKIEDVFKVFRENNIKPPQKTMPKIGNKGTNGTLKGLFLSGSVFLNIRTIMQIMIKDVNVPKLHNSAEMFRSINKEPIITTRPQTQVKRLGTLVFLFTTLKFLGKNLSRLIAYSILTVPS